MKKIVLSICLALIALFIFAETNVSINKEMYVKENLKLRAEESTSASVLAVMQAGTKVKIIEIGKEAVIDSIRSNWVKIEVLEGKNTSGKIIEQNTIGWCYGGYLADYVGRFDYIDLSDRNFKIQKIDFKTELDSIAWKKLAGYYFSRSARAKINVPEETDTPWGRDYVEFGIGTHSISYKNGKWIHDGDGEAEEFELVSISADGKSFEMKNHYHSQTWEIDGANLYIDNWPFYKITGPDCYKRFLKEFVAEYNKSIYKHKVKIAEFTDSLGTIPYEILKALEAGDIKVYSKYARKDKPVDLKIGDYRGNKSFSYNDLEEEAEDVQDAFDFMKSDLLSHSNEIDTIKPNINDFIETDVKAFEKNYPEANVLVEYIFSDYEYVELFFKVNENNVILVGVEEYAEFRR